LRKDVVTVYGNCEAAPCRREDVKITDQDDLPTVSGKKYHKDSEPTLEEFAASDRG
jgi:hypothetical protein